jgi:alanine-glyoxylate transaminase/serine-glyoxylate transaminase/serine-pyruvate transaminase
VSFSPRAQDVIKSRKTKVQSWFMDLNLVMGYWGSGAKRAYHHTAPINALYGLHESLVILQEEGIENAWARHRQNHLALKAGIEAMGLSFVVKEAERLPQLNSVYVPEGVDDAAVRRLLIEDYGLEIGAGLGVMAGNIWRLGLMGHACNMRNVLVCLAALEDVLGRLGASIAKGRAVAAARAVYAQG